MLLPVGTPRLQRPLLRPQANVTTDRGSQIQRDFIALVTLLLLMLSTTAQANTTAHANDDPERPTSPAFPNRAVAPMNHVEKGPPSILAGETNPASPDDPGIDP